MAETKPITVRARAPLRLGLAGGGTDISPYSEEYGGFIMNATIDMYAYCTIEMVNDGQITFYAADRDEFYQTPIKEFIELNGQLNLHKGVYNRIVREFVHKPLPLKITTYSDAPAGSGLGSSSTLVVAMIKAYEEALKLPLGEYDVARAAYEVERKEVGLSGGKQDQYAATFGGFNFIEFYANDRVIVNPLRVKKWITNELESSIILYYTGLSRDSDKIIDEQASYMIKNNTQTLEALHELKADALAMKEMILKGDIVNFAHYLGKSWQAKKRTASAVSNELIEKVYETAMRAGAYAAKVSGAGGGGFMMIMVDPVTKTQIIRELSKLEGQVVNFHFTTEGAQSWWI